MDYEKNRKVLRSTPRRLVGIDAGGVFRFENWRAFTLAEMAATPRGLATMQSAYNSLCDRIAPDGKILNCPNVLTKLGLAVRLDMHGTIPTEAPGTQAA